MTFDFSGQGVVVTGGAQGIGLEIARSFLACGAKVAIWDFSESGLASARDELKPYAELLELSRVDVADMASCQAAAAKLSLTPNILVNNAGITRDKSFAKLSCEDFDAVIQTNLTGVFHVSKALLNLFPVGAAPKRIINMASIVALYGNFGQANYAAAKAGLIGLTKTLARELGPKGFTVNAIAPGFIKTAMTASMPPEILAGIQSKVPVGRLGVPSDIAAACLFLASPMAGYINAAVLPIDGGLIL